MLSSDRRPSYEVCSPVRAGSSPHATRRHAASTFAGLGLGLGLVALLAGCQGSSSQEQSPVVLAMTTSLTPIFATQQLTLYEVQTPVPFPVRAPSSQQESSLGGAEAPYPHAPYLLSSDESIEVRFTISNLDTEEHSVYLCMDPWNEFVRYRPGVAFVNDEETLPNPSGFYKPFLLDPMSRVQGTVTTDDTSAMAIGLATAMNILSMPADPMAEYSPTTLVDNVFNLQNRPLSSDPLVSQYVPGVIAGLTGFDLGLQTTSPENVSIEILVDITDLNGNRIIPQGQSGTPIGIPTTILSPVPASQGGTGTGTTADAGS